MSRDLQLTFSQAQTVGTAAGTALGTNVIKGSGYRLGRGGDVLRFIVKVDEAFVSATGTLDIQLVEADNEALTTGAVTLYSTGAKAAADLALNGKAYYVDVPMPKTSGKSFIGVKFVTATAGFTAGKVTAWIDADSATPLNDRPYFETGR